MTKTQVTMVNEAACSSSQADTINSNTNTSVNLNTNKNFTTNSTMNDANGTLASTIPSSALDQSLSRLQAQQSQQLQQQQQANTTNRTCTNNTSSARPSKRSANDYRFGKTIGEGSFSTVYIAQDIHTKREVAIKVCEKQLIIREKKERYIRREREVMHMLSGTPGFVSLLCTFQDPKNLYFVMTLAKNGDLLPYINRVGSFDFKCTQFYAAELILAIELMHQKGIVHRDLKPENILLDENMHTLIADFGSARILDEMNGESDYESRKRTNSFVGTAHYVSPEILKGEQLTKAADLWALGCIIYQMISGLPPFRGGSEYLIFQKILERDLQFPDGFNRQARDLVQRLIQIEPDNRLGALDQHDLYESIRNHEFFDGIVWDTLRSQTPPPIHPYLPGLDGNEDAPPIVEYRVPDHLEPGLGEDQLRRLLELELGTGNLNAPANHLEPSDDDEPREEENEPQQVEVAVHPVHPVHPVHIVNTVQSNNQPIPKDSVWYRFTEGELIIKMGFILKRKGLFSRKRMLLLTTGPRMHYIDPSSMIKKGEIPMGPEIRAEPKNFRIFFVHTPSRTYYLEDPEGYALDWCEAIEEVRRKYYGNVRVSTIENSCADPCANPCVNQS